MDLTKMERRGSGCLLTVLVGLVAMVVLPLLGVALFATPRRDQPFVLGLVAFLAVACSAIVPAVLWLSLHGRRSQAVRARLDPLAAALSGTAVYPTWRTSVAAPRVEAIVGGVPLELRLLRVQRNAGSFVMAAAIETPHARTGAQLYLPNFRVHLQLRRPVRHRFGIVTRTKLASFGTAFTTMQALLSGDPGYDERFAAAAEPGGPIGALFVQDAAFRQAAAALVTVNPPFLTNATFGPDGISWLGISSVELTPQRLAELPAALLAFARRLD